MASDLTKYAKTKRIAQTKRGKHFIFPKIFKTRKKKSCCCCFKGSKSCFYKVFALLSQNHFFVLMFLCVSMW